MTIKDISVAIPIERGVLSFVSSVFAARYAPIDIDTPSAKRLASQSMMMIFADSPPPVAPATTANVVIVPSIAQ